MTFCLLPYAAFSSQLRKSSHTARHSHVLIEDGSLSGERTERFQERRAVQGVPGRTQEPRLDAICYTDALQSRSRRNVLTMFYVLLGNVEPAPRLERVTS